MLVILAFIASGAFWYGRFATRQAASYRNEDQIWHGVRCQKELREKYGDDLFRELMINRSTKLSQCAAIVCVVLTALALAEYVLTQ